MMGFWRDLLRTLAKNPISMFAVLCVAATGIFLAIMARRMMGVLESTSWCSTALQAERITAKESFVGLTTCVELLKIQLSAIATGFHISTGGFVFVLIVLIVVVVAGARASWKISMSGIEGNVGKHDAGVAGQHVADEAQDAADDIKAGTATPKAADAGLPDALK